jgi:hypothetical protein
MRHHDDVQESVSIESVTAREPFRRDRTTALTSSVPWLLVVLAVQALLSLRLVWSDTADTNEALNLWAGHLEWLHWLHGAPIPAFPLYFSGAPVIYPPLGALADSHGGLAVARIASLGLMLAATVTLWATARRLGGPRVAFFAAAGWAVLAPTIRLGAYASQEPLSLLLVALAAWCVTMAATHGNGTGWLLAATVALAAGNAAAYESVIADPVIVAMAGLADVGEQGRKMAIARSAAMLTYVSAALILLIKIAGPDYTSGILATTFPGKGTRVAAGHGPLSWHWTYGLGLAAVGTAVLLSLVVRRNRHRTGLIAVLAGAALIAPAAHAITRPVTSLGDDVDFGLWFAAIAVGYAVDGAAALLRFRVWRSALTGACALAVIPLAWSGADAARRSFSWPDAAAFVTAFRPLADSGAGHMLVEGAPVPKYYLAAGRQWQRWSDTFSITAATGRSVGYSTTDVTAYGNPRTYHRYLDGGYFSVIALNFTTGIGLDAQIAKRLDHDPGYRVVMRVPYGHIFYVVWKRVHPNQP